MTVWPFKTFAQPDLRSQLDTYLHQAAEYGQFNGTALIAKGDSILLAKGYGWRNAVLHETNDINTRYQIGSMTKPFTAEVVLELQEQGKLAINDKLSSYLPDYPNGDKITLENLLDHTSGVYNYNVDETDTVAWSPVKKETMLSLFRDKPLDFKPGTQFSYSNSGYFLLGLVIEKVTGMSYTQAISQMLFIPLGMTHSGFDFIHFQGPDKAIGYAVLDKSEQRPAHLIDSTVSYAAGGMYTNAPDLFKWVRSVAKNQLLSPALWKKAHTPVRSNYGYGWIVNRLNGERYFGHGGGIMGFTSLLLYFPGKDITVILLDNTFNESDPVLLPAQGLTAILFHKAYDQLRPTVKFADTAMAKYAGTYVLVSEPGRKMIIEQHNGHLFARVPGTPPLELAFQTTTTFLFKDVPNAAGAFVLENQEITKIMVRQNGRNYEWKRLL